MHTPDDFKPDALPQNTSTPALFQPKKQQNTFSDAVENILHKNLSTLEQTEVVDYPYINNTMMEYFYFGSKLRELQVLFPDIYEPEWNHLQTHVDNLKNTVFSGGAEPDEEAMLAWYRTGGEHDLKVAKDIISFILTEVIDTYEDLSTVWLAYMLWGELFPGHTLPSADSGISYKPKTTYREIFK